MLAVENVQRPGSARTHYIKSSSQLNTPQTPSALSEKARRGKEREMVSRLKGGRERPTPP